MGRYGYRRNRAREAGSLISLFIAMFIVAVGYGLFMAAVEFLQTPIGMWSTFIAIFATIAGFIYSSKKAAEQAELFRQEIEKVNISDDRNDYLIESNDYRRGNAKENMYRRAFQPSLLEIFGNRCAKCGANDNGLDLDHFVLSKNEGGNFILRHRDGHLINNAIPLCQTCNRSKSDRSYKHFFSQDQLLEVFKKNAAMTVLVNEKNPIDKDGNVLKKSPRRA